MSAGLALLAACATAPGQELRSRAERLYQAEDAQALDAYRRLTDAAAASAEDWFRLGNLQVRAGDLEAAIESFRAALQRDPGFAPARHNLALVHLQLGVSQLLQARRALPEVDREAAATMRYLACVMETFLGQPEPVTCREQPEPAPP